MCVYIVLSFDKFPKPASCSSVTHCVGVPDHTTRCMFSLVNICGFRQHAERDRERQRESPSVFNPVYVV